jgi:hypothetical protein
MLQPGRQAALHLKELLLLETVFGTWLVSSVRICGIPDSVLDRSKKIFVCL